MRIGFLGPSGGDIDQLERAATFLLENQRVSRAIYLDTDGALDRCVIMWARRLVGEDPSDEGAWKRAAEVAVTGTPIEIDDFVWSERERMRLRSLVSLPEDFPCATETLGDDTLVVVTHDPLILNEDLVAHAQLLVYGSAPLPTFERGGTRCSLSPGPLGRHGGIAVLDGSHDPPIILVYDTYEQREIMREEMLLPSTTRFGTVPEEG